MMDYGYILASEIVVQIRPIGFQGVGRLPQFTQPAIRALQRVVARPDAAGPAVVEHPRGSARYGRTSAPFHVRTDRRRVDRSLSHQRRRDQRLPGGGATLIYNHFQESSRIVQRIQESLEYQLDARVWIQAYLTTSDESAFGLHVDDHNFVVLQVVGPKAWEVEIGTARPPGFALLAWDSG